MANKAETHIQDIYPLTPLQQGILVLTLQDPLAYFEQISVNLHGEVDAGILRQAWQSVVDRHPALRASILWQRKKEPLQVVHARVAVPFAFHDLTGVAPQLREARFEALCKEDRDRPFSLGKPPLLRVALFKLDATHYRLLFSHHHILCDGWSLAVLLREVLECYRANLTGAPWTPPPARPFRDYIGWLQRRDSAAALAFWRDELQGLQETPLPEGFPSAATESPYAEERRTLPGPLAARIRDLARDWRITPSAFLQGLWALTLARQTDTEDVCFGCTVSGRTASIPGINEMVGMFISTIPVRIRLDASMQVADLFAMVQQRLARAQEYDWVALPEMRRAAALPSDMSLFDSIVVVENHPLSSVQDTLEGFPFSASAHGSFERTGYPLTLSIIPDGEIYHLECAYQTDKLDRATIARTLARFDALAREVVANPTAVVGNLDGMPASDREWLAARNTPIRYDSESTPLPVLFDRYADEHPEAPAVILGERQFTYGMLRDLSNRIAHLLAARGAGTESRVGLCVEKRVELPALLLGVMKAGACALLLDPAQAARRTAGILTDTQPCLTVTEAEVSELPGAVLRLDDLLRECSTYPATPLSCTIHPESLAYVIFTSGSTGRPKGVGVAHRALAITTRAWQAAYDLQPGMRHLQMANVAFDVFCGDFARALGSGGCLVLCPRETLLAPPDLLILLQRQRIDCAEFVPAVMRGLMEQARAANVPIPIHHLVAIGSDVWHVQEHRELRALLPTDTRLVDSYGLTEATIDSCFYEGDLAGYPAAACTPIGYRLPHVRIYVLDRGLNPVPPGVTGELYVGGTALARGYLSRPDLTAGSFIPDPFADVPGARMYRTGDAARYRPDGTLELLGRKDSQVKVRGVRIETGEVETCLRACRGIRDAIVDARARNGSDKRLVAYCIADEGHPDAHYLRTALKEMLPETMVPSAFLFVPEFPLNQNGKVNRRALPDPDPDADTREVTAPRTPVEEIVAGVWQQVLKAAASKSPCRRTRSGW
ncbi:MAG TPA: amino acid adenylation domain-containing protein, partial [Armatimonadota bacterium]|nr:amino acid adenylation domain-containing protein [Armatimonadota bacterium]